MSWQERIQTSTIEVPDGTVFEVEFLDISGKRNERATVFKFSEYSGDYVQRLSSGSDAYTIQVFFSGTDHDIVANSFKEKTKDTRPLFWVHPLEGRLKVQLLSLQKDDKLATSANETSFILSLHTTISEELPLSTINTASQIDIINQQKEIDNANSFVDVEDVNGAKFDLLAAVEEVNRAFNFYFDVALDVLQEFEQIRLTAIGALNTIETNIKSAAFAVQRLVAFPAKVTSSIGSKFSFYSEILSFGSRNLSEPSAFELFQSSSLIGYSQVASGASSDDFVDRNAVFATADTLMSYLDNYVLFLDDYNPNRDIHLAVITAVSLAVGVIDILALGAKQERVLVLNKRTDLWILAYSLYSPRTPDDLDSAVEDLIAINDINGTEIFELEIGREIRYYV